MAKEFHLFLRHFKFERIVKPIIASKIMKSGGSQMGVFFLIVRFHGGGSATNGPTLPTLPYLCLYEQDSQTQRMLNKNICI